MADTQPLAPTDAEIFAVAREAGLLPDNSHPTPETRAARKHSGAVQAFARAALAKWGAQPVAPVWTPASTPPKEEDGEVLVRMADGRCEIAWATYWHGSSNAFAQWTFRDPDEDEQPVEWMHIPKHCATTPQPTQPQAGAVPLTDEQIRAMCKESWVFETVKQWVRITEQHHGIKGGQHGTE